MKTFCSFVFVVFVLYSKMFSQSLRYTIAQPYISLSAYSIQHNDPFSFYGNQAALAQIKNAGAGVFAERRFLLAETSVYHIAGAMPTAFGNFGLQVQYAGFKNFNEQKMGLAYARSLGKKADIGIQFNYNSYRVPNYANAAAINVEVGLMMHVTDQLHAGIHMYNPVGGKFGKNSEEKLASAFKAGIGYDASENFYIATELIKEEDKPINVIVGMQYRFAQQFFARAGFMSETGSFYGGAGLQLKKIRIDISSSYHPQLGFSPGILFLMNFKNQEE